MKHLLNLSQDEVLQEYIDAFDKQERDRISTENFWDFSQKEDEEKNLSVYDKMVKTQIIKRMLIF